jgi:hypothetical protein
MIMKPLIFSVLSMMLLLTAAPTAAQKRRSVQVPEEIIQELSKDEDIKKCLEPDNGGVDKNLKAELLYLNRDEVPELLVHGTGSCICGMNNCDFWIYRKTANGYQMILDAGFINHIELRKTFTNDYRDLVGAMHGSAFDSDLFVYKFDGKRYRLKECLQRHYNSWEDRRGRFHVSKRPRITRVKCEPER